MCYCLSVESLKCHRTIIENGEQIVRLQECRRYDDNEPAKGCGRFTNANGTQYDCAHESLMEKHGVSETGCADDLIDDETGQTVDVEICYCSTDGCNRNYTCCDKSDRESGNFAKPPSSNLSVTFIPGSTETTIFKLSTTSRPNSTTTGSTNTAEHGSSHAEKHSSGKYTSSPMSLLILTIVFLLVKRIFV